MKHLEKPFLRAQYEERTTAHLIAAIEAALRDMNVMVTVLDRYVATEEIRTRITDMSRAQ